MTVQTKYLRQEGICNYFIKGCQNIVTYSISDGKFNNVSSEKHISTKFLHKSDQVASLYTDRIIFKIKGGGRKRAERKCKLVPLAISSRVSWEGSFAWSQLTSPWF